MAPVLGDTTPPDPAEEAGKKQKRKMELPALLLLINEDNIYDCCVIGDQMHTNKKTGEVTGPHKLVMSLKYPEQALSVTDKAAADKPDTIWLEFDAETITIDQW
jgi:hypothetical protein